MVVVTGTVVVDVVDVLSAPPPEEHEVNPITQITTNRKVLVLMSKRR